ncbi:MAG: hypothetical protein ACOCWJ_01950 [Verrucomicrobiota bacterium]
MSNRCDKLRADALLNGLYSDAGRQWQAHAEHCQACRSELRILGDLRESENGNMHLKRSSVEQLLKEVDIQGRHHRKLTPFRLALQFACLLTIALCAAVLYNTGAAIGGASRNDEPATVRNTLERIAADMLDEKNHVFGIMEFTSAFGDSETAADNPAIPTADRIDERLTTLRMSIDRERRQLLEVCEPEVDNAYWTNFRANDLDDLIME